MKSINCILIANRGEIASRVIRTCRRMGIRSVAVYSDVDRDHPFVEEADLAIHIGESAPATSYLDQDKIIEAAKRSGAEAIHPGYGFLSENAGFARRCAEEGIIFIGPHPEAIEAMGSKSRAKALMEESGVPVVPGYRGDDQTSETLTAEANRIGYPVLLKATAGGGGKGMRIVHSEAEVAGAIEAAKRESLSAFGDDEMLVEKYVASGRHIEFQIFGDQHGNAIHLLERECTIQRRYQKVIEESPSPVMDEALRQKMGEAAVNAAKALNYDNAGTVEFIYDDKSGEFYFLEVNTRLQVEHPVTEEITGLDLVKLQIESAQGQALSVSQDQVAGCGYAVECRLYAEDPANNFLPVTGTVHRFELPEVEGLRVESAIRSGSEISVWYDPMIAKLIVWDATRSGAHRKMKYVLDHMSCLGTTTNQTFLSQLFAHEEFGRGEYNTHFIEEKFNLKASDDEEQKWQAAIAATLRDWSLRESSRSVLRHIPSGWRNNYSDPQRLTYAVGETDVAVAYRHLGDRQFEFHQDEKVCKVRLLDASKDEVSFEMDGIRMQASCMGSASMRYVQLPANSIQLELKPRFPEVGGDAGDGGYTAPMPSQVIKVMVKAGDKVEEGDTLLILSSMKMESSVLAHASGTVEEVFVEDGQHVEAGGELIRMEHV